MGKDHGRCVLPAADHQGENIGTGNSLAQRSKPCNVLMYVRKSDDVEEILDALRDCVLYLSQKMLERSSEHRRIQYVYLERWALDALE